MAVQKTAPSYNTYYNLCRFCLIDSVDKLNVFEKRARELEILVKTESLLSIYVREDDGLPQYICLQCMTRIEDFYNYRANCCKAEETLRDWMPRALRSRRKGSVTEQETEHKDLTQDVETFRSESYVQDYNSYESPKYSTNLSPIVKLRRLNDLQVDNYSMHKTQIVKTCTEMRQEDTYAVDSNLEFDKCNIEAIMKGTSSIFSPVVKLEKLVIPSGLKVTNMPLEWKVSSEENKDNLKLPEKIVLENSEVPVSEMVDLEALRTVYSCNNPSRNENLISSHVWEKKTDNICTSLSPTQKEEACPLVRKREPIPNWKLKPFECHMCDKTFSAKSLLRQHALVHSKVRIKCNVCSKEFRVRSSLDVHMQRHTGVKIFSCSLCSQKFTRKRGLALHMVLHSGVKRYECNVCGKCFAAKTTLYSHSKMHSGEKPYSCHICMQEFVYHNSLKRHVQSHLGLKPFKCSVCSQAFADAVTVTRHMRNHTGERPFKCGDCSKTFMQRAHLLEHTKVHTHEKPFSCDECGSKFAYRYSLRKHLKMH